MPIKSYLAYPYKGKINSLIQELNKLEQCEVIPSKNEAIVVVVTETKTKEEDILLKDTIDLD